MKNAWKDTIIGLFESKPFLFVSRIIVGLLFISSGLVKLIQPVEYFEIAINRYQMVPLAVAHIAAYIIPWVELVFGTYLFLGYWLHRSASVLAILTGIFQIALAQALLRNLGLDNCGCFGNGSIHLTLYQSFLIDTVMLLCLIQIATSKNRPLFSLDHCLDSR